MCQRTFQAFFPTGAKVVKIRTSAIGLSGWVHLHTVFRADNPDERPFGENLVATHTGSLGHMLNSFTSFLGHILRFPIPFRCAAFMFLLGDHNIAIWIVDHFDTLALLFALLGLAGHRSCFFLVFGFFNDCGIDHFGA